MANCRAIIVAHSSLCCVVGYSAFIAFLVLQCYPASAFALLTGITDSVTLFLNILAYKETLQLWFSFKGLKIFFNTGMVVTVCAIASSICYVSLQIETKRAIFPIAPSYVMPIVWSIILIRAGILLMYHSSKYERDISSEPLLLNDEDGQFEDSENSRNIHS